jgi:hypothetical protein
VIATISSARGWLYGLALAVMIGLGIAAYVQTQRLDAANARLRASQTEVSRLTGQLAAADQHLANQNAAVEALSRQAEADRKVYMKALSDANRVAAQAQARAEDIMSRPVPPPDQREAAARALVDEQIRRERQ